MKNKAKKTQATDHRPLTTDPSSPFDQLIDRTGTNAMMVQGYAGYLFNEEEMAQIPFSAEELIPMWVADMDFAIAPPIIQAMKDRLEHPILGYSMPFDPAYREAFRDWTQKQYEWACDPEDIVIAQGVIPALYSLVELMTQADEKVLVMTPSYAFFKHSADHNARELVCSPLVQEAGRYQIDFEDFRRKAEDEKVSLFILCSPHNPSGRVWTEEELRQIVRICRENAVSIIADEIHCDLLRKGLRFTPLAKLFPDAEDIVTCMAPSKTFNLAGIMMANIIIPQEDLRAQWNKRNLPVANPLSIAAVQAAYTQGQPWMEELKTYLDGNFAFLKAFLEEHLPKAKFHIPDATYLAWIDMGAYFPPEENLTLFFAKHAGVLLEGGNMFVDNAEGFIRLNLACPMAKLEEGLRRILSSLESP